MPRTRGRRSCRRGSLRRRGSGRRGCRPGRLVERRRTSVTREWWACRRSPRGPSLRTAPRRAARVVRPRAGRDRRRRRRRAHPRRRCARTRSVRPASPRSGRVTPVRPPAPTPPRCESAQPSSERPSRQWYAPLPIRFALHFGWDGPTGMQRKPAGEGAWEGCGSGDRWSATPRDADVEGRGRHDPEHLGVGRRIGRVGTLVAIQRGVQSDEVVGGELRPVAVECSVSLGLDR